MGRRGKFARLVDDFVATVDRLGGRGDPETVAEELQARIDEIAAQIGVTAQTVLRTYIPDEWGQQMATAMMAGGRGHDAATVEGPDEHFAVRVVARLLAALGQAMLFATVNSDHAQPQPRMNARVAAEAVTGLSMAIHGTPPGDDLVKVESQIVGWTRNTLEVFRDQLSAGAWSSCPCGETHGQDDTDAAVLRAICADLLLLPDPAAHRPAGG